MKHKNHIILFFSSQQALTSSK